MANPAQEADLATLLQQAGIPIDPMSGNGDTNPPTDSTPPAPAQPVAAMQSNDQVDPTTGAPLPAPDPAMPEVAQTMLGRIRQANPDAADQSDFQLARTLYNQGMHRPNEAFPQFATRMGIQMGAGETLLNSGLTNAAMHVNQPIEAGLSGVGGLLTGEGFGPAFDQKMQELHDQESVGGYQHPNAAGIGDMAGTAADMIRFGPAIRAGVRAIPGASVLSKSGPLGDSMTQMAGLNAVNDAIPNIQDATHPDGFSWGDLLSDETGSVVKGLAAGALGSAVSKTLSGVVAPLARGIGGGLDAADSALKGLARTIYTRAAGNMSKDFVGAGPSPAASALSLDNDFYGNLLNKSGMNIPKALGQLEDLSAQPGFANKIWDILQPGKPIPAGTTPDMVMQRLRDTVTAADQTDPSGQLTRSWMSKLYGSLIPQRLAGPFDSTPGFDDVLAKMRASGSLTSNGKLIDAPVTGMGALTKALWERTGGGPGRVMWPMLNQPKGAIGGLAAVAGNLGVGIPGKGLSLGAKAGAGVADALGAPGDYLLGKLPEPAMQEMAGPPVSNSLADKLALMKPAPGVLNKTLYGLHDLNQGSPGLWQNYLNTEMGNRGAQPDISAFPDIYSPPAPMQMPPANSQHSEVMQWLGTAPRQTAMAYIGSKLGPQVAQQMAQAGDNWKAALFNLAADPKSRAALMPADDQTG
jgi:hypothetical protein